MKLLGPHALTSLIVKDIPIFSSLIFASFWFVCQWFPQGSRSKET